MARIGFAALPDEPGHLAAFFSLAGRLCRNGHEVLFLGVPDDEPHVAKRGFPYRIVGANVFPRGYFDEMKRALPAGKSLGPLATVRQHKTLMRELTNAATGQGLQLDMIVADGLNLFGALLAYRIGAQCVLLHTTLFPDNRALPPAWSGARPGENGRLSLRARLAWFRPMLRKLDPEWWIWRLACQRMQATQEHTLQQLAPSLGLSSFSELVDHTTNLIACPYPFDFPHDPPAGRHHVDALIDRDRPSGHTEIDWGRIAASGKLVYVSMGTQAWLMQEPLRFFRHLYEVAGRHPEWHVLVSSGAYLKLDSLTPPANVSICRTVPQIQVLERADVMVTHAGLNSVKECIHAGVPMAAFPLSRDQPGNAARVEFHGLGLRGNYRQADTDTLDTMLTRIVSDDGYRQRTRQMSEVFRAAEKRNDAVRIIERLLEEPRPGPHAHPPETVAI